MRSATGVLIRISIICQNKQQRGDATYNTGGTANHTAVSRRSTNYTIYYGQLRNPTDRQPCFPAVPARLIIICVLLNRRTVLFVKSAFNTPLSLF